jgi:uncharacterized protein
MKKFLLISFLFFTVALSGQIDKILPARPNPPVLVNDLAKMLTDAQRLSLENKLDAFNDSTSNQIAIVTVETLNDYDPNEYAVALGRKWGVGTKEFNNGIVMLISTGGGEGHRVAYIATGYGLEGAVPDITAKEIVDNDLIPYFKQKDFYQGLDRATDDLIRATRGEYKSPANKGRNKMSPFGRIFFILVILVALLSFFGRGTGGTMISRRGFGLWWLPFLLGGGGNRGGGGWSGGGGGGFGGFGGGSFGGGGAGGSW